MAYLPLMRALGGSGFPYPPNDAIAAIQAAEDVYVAVNITEEEFVVMTAGETGQRAL